MEPNFLNFSEEFTVIIPNNSSMPSFPRIFLPHKRQHREDTPGHALARFFSPPPQEFLCVVCQNVVKKPLECKKCGKLYCETCSLTLHTVEGVKGNRLFMCSVCNSSYEPKPPSQVLIRMIMEQKIKCNNYESGCKDPITLDEMSRHEMTCPYREVECENFKHCNRSGLIKDFIEIEGAIRSIYSHISHRTHIRNRCYTCSDHCKKVISFEKMVYEKQYHLALLEYKSLLDRSRIED